MKHLLHFQQFVPPFVRKQAESLRGSRLIFGPHALQRWAAKFGSIPRPTALPDSAYFLEIVIAPVHHDAMIDTVLFRYHLDDATDVILSVVAKTKFVCSAWRIPRWYGQGLGRPRNPAKYLTKQSFQQLFQGR